MNSTKKTVPRKGDRLYKTVMCKNYKAEGKCKYGNRCTFAHGEKDLRGQPIRRRGHCGMSLKDYLPSDLFAECDGTDSTESSGSFDLDRLKLNPNAPVFTPAFY